MPTAKADSVTQAAGMLAIAFVVVLFKYTRQVGASLARLFGI